MKKILISILKYADISLLLMMGGCTAGYAFSVNGPAIDSIQWKQMPPPPEPAFRIIELDGYGGDRNSIIVMSANGIQYECCGPWPSVWNQVTYNHERYGMACDQVESTVMDELPVKPVDCAFVSQFEWTTEQYYAALLPDGAIWRWRYHHGLGDILNGMVNGAGIGLLISIVWIIYRQVALRRLIPAE